jgi:UDP-N-acetylglucosamine 4,6-dehydratase
LLTTTVHAHDMGEYYRIPADTRDLNYTKYFEEGETVVTQAHEYHSHNTRQLNKEQLQKLLLSVLEIQDDLKKIGIIQ